jgi:hypothetical protein
VVSRGCGRRVCDGRLGGLCGDLTGWGGGLLWQIGAEGAGTLWQRYARDDLRGGIGPSVKGAFFVFEFFDNLLHVRRLTMGVVHRWGS